MSYFATLINGIHYNQTRASKKNLLVSNKHGANSETLKTEVQSKRDIFRISVVYKVAYQTGYELKRSKPGGVKKQ